MHRRSFLHSVTAAGTALASAVLGRVAFAGADGAATTRRYTEQRWALDNIIRANGIDWDQPRSFYLSAPCGVEANADFAAIRARVQKMADIGPAFESTAKRRETKAQAAKADGNLITARDNWYMAAIYYGAAEWPYDDSGRPMSNFTKRNASVSLVMLGSPTTRSRRHRSRSKGNQFPPGFTCHRAIAAANSRLSLPFREWTRLRKPVSRWRMIAG